MVKELKKIGRLIYETGSNGITMYILDPNNNYAEVYLNFYERREFLLDLLKSEMEKVETELYVNTEEIKKCSEGDDHYKQKLQKREKDLMIYYENLDMTYKNLKKIVEGDE